MAGHTIHYITPWESNSLLTLEALIQGMPTQGSEDALFLAEFVYTIKAKYIGDAKLKSENPTITFTDDQMGWLEKLATAEEIRPERVTADYGFLIGAINDLL